MSRPVSAATRALVLCAFVAACRELPTPTDGVQSVSRVLLPSPGLVVGDTMRDSLGAVAPLRVVAFDERGDTILPSPAATFIVLDTTAQLAGAFLIGRATGTARVMATVAGLQTQVQTAVVTLRPDTIMASDSARHVRRVNLLAGDTSFASAELGVIVQHRDGASTSGVDAVVVTYSFDRRPGAPANPQVVFVGSASGSVRDTTSSGGRAGRAVRLRIPAQPVLPDSAVVRATASYRGQPLGQVVFTVVFQTQTQ